MGISQTDDHYYIVTEFMPKKSLEYVLKDEKIVLDNKIKMRMALDIAKAICFLHSAVPAILHRDLKTANCLCDEALNIKIADFG